MNFYPADADYGLYVTTGFGVRSLPISDVALLSFITCLVVWSFDYLMTTGGFFMSLGEMI